MIRSIEKNVFLLFLSVDKLIEWDSSNAIAIAFATQLI